MIRCTSLICPCLFLRRLMSPTYPQQLSSDWSAHLFLWLVGNRWCCDQAEYKPGGENVRVPDKNIPDGIKCYVSAASHDLCWWHRWQRMEGDCVTWFKSPGKAVALLLIWWFVGTFNVWHSSRTWSAADCGSRAATITNQVGRSIHCQSSFRPSFILLSNRKWLGGSPDETYLPIRLGCRKTTPRSCWAQRTSRRAS